MATLHTRKVTDEKNAFIEELFESLPTKEDLISKELHPRARTIHHVLLPAYIMKHYDQNTFISSYLDSIFTSLIESECLFILGFKNAGMSSMRSAIESTFKFIYYEYHPIENLLHSQGLHSLNGNNYREFIFMFPGLNEISFISKDIIERFWANLCSYVHSDLKVINKMTVVSDISELPPEK